MAYRVEKVARKKGAQFIIRFEKEVNGVRNAPIIPKKDWAKWGFSEEMPIEDARAQCQSLNAQEHLQRHHERRLNIASRLEHADKVQMAFLPEAYVKEYEAKIFGRTHITKKLATQWRAAKRVMVAIELHPSQWAENSGRFYDFFSSHKYSVYYSIKIISILNAWGHFYCKKTEKFFEPIKPPKGHEREVIADANHDAEGAGNKVSDPLTPKMLETKKSELRPEHYNWLYLSIWIGLRPGEIDSLTNLKNFRITPHEGELFILEVYQSKLTAIPKDKRWKLIPCFLPEQIQALKIIESKLFKRPLTKSVAGWFNERVGLYGGRKGFVNLMQTKGQLLEDITQWLGHRDINTTWKHYKDMKKVNFTKVA